MVCHRIATLACLSFTGLYGEFICRRVRVRSLATLLHVGHLEKRYVTLHSLKTLHLPSNPCISAPSTSTSAVCSSVRQSGFVKQECAFLGGAINYTETVYLHATAFVYRCCTGRPGSFLSLCHQIQQNRRDGSLFERGPLHTQHV